MSHVDVIDAQIKIVLLIFSLRQGFTCAIRGKGLGNDFNQVSVFTHSC